MTGEETRQENEGLNRQTMKGMSENMSVLPRLQVWVCWGVRSENAGVLGLGVLGSESGNSGPRSRNFGVPGLEMLGSDVKLERPLGQESPW